MGSGQLSIQHVQPQQVLTTVASENLRRCCGHGIKSLGDYNIVNLKKNIKQYVLPEIFIPTMGGNTL